MDDGEKWKMDLYSYPSWMASVLFVTVFPPTEDQEDEITKDGSAEEISDLSFVEWELEEVEEVEELEEVEEERDDDKEEEALFDEDRMDPLRERWYRLLADSSKELCTEVPRRLADSSKELFTEFSAQSSKSVVSLRQFSREQWLSSSAAFSNVRMITSSPVSGIDIDHPVLLPAAALLLLVLVTNLLLWIRRRQRKQELARPRARILSDSVRNYDMSTGLDTSRARRRLWSKSISSSDLRSADNLNKRLLMKNQSSRDLITELELEDPQQRVMMQMENKSNGEAQQHYYGPSIETIVYETWTPPPSWGEASRKLLPQDTMRMNLAREISLSLTAEPSICIREPDDRGESKRHRQHDDHPVRLPVNICSVHPKPPTDGGVLEIYVKDSPREQWMEHTFSSAHAAAQFQIDLLAMQLLGDSIHNMYQALKIVHQGSVAHAGKEFVLHDCVCEEAVGGDNGADNTKSPYVTGGGVAWDDVMRCLGSSFPAINWKLETLWWLEKVQSDTAATSTTSPRRNPSGQTEAPVIADSTAETSGENGESTHSMQPEYLKKRMLVGPVDFFRLFVPSLPETEVPKQKSTRARMEQMLRWRKRVARASVLVQSYTRARTVANLGWHLNRSLPEHYLKRRLAYDDTTENGLHDTTVINEIYEATVSRDVICHVRSPDCLRSEPWWLLGLSGSIKPARSGYQGYTFVENHVFQLPPEGVDHQFTFEKDPVLAIPSLRATIEANPELEFFVSAMRVESKRFVAISLFVRSLPVGIDPKFDTVVDRFVSGDEEVRKRKLEILFQLGTDMIRLSLFSRAALTLLSFLLRWTIGTGNKHVPQPANVNDRTSIPAIKLDRCGETRHFGGSLQSDHTLPLNYVACTLRLDSRRRNCFATRILITYMEEGGLARDAVDFTYVLAGETEDELPERALATCRKVYFSGDTVALPVSHSMSHEAAMTRYVVAASSRASLVTSSIGLYFRIFVTDPAIAALSPITRRSLRRGNSALDTPKPGRRNELAKSPGIDNECDVVTSNDPFEKAVNELLEILEDVTVPVRKSQMPRLHAAPSPLLVTNTSTTLDTAPILRDDLMQVSILRRINRSDIRRYFVATNCVLKDTAVRIVESAAWRGLTFPIEMRTCRIELQNGQFFQQGRDLEGNPVYYFQNTLLGPWRKDEDAVIASVLHRLETSLNEFARVNPEVKCTLIVSMGKPVREKRKKQKVESGGSATGEASEEPENGITEVSTPEEEGVEVALEDDGETVEYEEDSSLMGLTTTPAAHNPRIHSDEQWYTHTSKQLIRRMIDIITTHYPERLSKALVVVGKGNAAYTRTAVGGMLALPQVLSRQRTREKVKFLIRYADLQEYVAKDELSVLVGGTATVDPSVFECR